MARPRYIQEDEEKKKQQQAAQPKKETTVVDMSKHGTISTAKKAANAPAAPGVPVTQRNYSFAYEEKTVDLNTMTDKRAASLASTMRTDEERDGFLTTYRKHIAKKTSANYRQDVPTMETLRGMVDARVKGGVYADTRAKYQEKQDAIKTAMGAFNGLTDINGRAVNINTADMHTIMQSIRLEPNKRRREAFASAMKTLTKSEGSRFYGVEFDESLAKTFLETQVLTQSRYNGIVEDYGFIFDGRDGNEEKNKAAYAQEMAAIESGGYDEREKKIRLDALNDAYLEQTTTGTLPDLTGYTPPQEAADAPEEGEKAAEKEKTDWLGKALAWGKEALDGFLSNKAILTAGEFQFAKQVDKPKEIATGEWQGPVQKKAQKIPSLAEAMADEVYRQEHSTEHLQEEPAIGEWQGPAQQGEPKAPTPQEALADEAYMQAFIARKTAEAEAEGENVLEWQGPQFKSLFERSLEDGEYQAFVEEQLAKEEEPKEVQGPPRAPMLGAQEDNQVPKLIDTIYEKYGAPDAARGMGGSVQGSGTVDLTDDLGRAWFEYGGRFNELTKETQDMLIAMSGEDGVKAWMGILGDEEFARFAITNADGTTGQELNNEPAEFLYTQNMGKLGPQMMEFAEMIYDEAFPDELRGSAFMAGYQLIHEANEWAASERFSEDMLAVHGEAYTTDMVNVYEEYIRIHGQESAAARALSLAISYAEETKRKEAEAQMLAAESEARSAAQNLQIAREAVRSGMYTPEQMALVQENAPEMNRAAMKTDPMYRDLMQQLDDEWFFDTSDWMDAEVLAMAEVLGGEYTAERAEWASREVAHSFLEDVLRQKMDVAYSFGYDLNEYAKRYGGITLDSLHTEARMQMLRLGGSVDAVDMAIMEETKRFTGTGEGVTAGEIVGAAAGHGVTGALADPLEAFYTWMAGADLRRDSARVKATYDKDYGLFSETQLTHDLRAMAQGGYFPSEEMAQYVTAYLDAGGNPYELGLMPDDLQFVRKSAVALKQTKQAYAHWAERMLNESQGTAFEIGSAITDNATRMVLSSVVQGVSGSAFVGTMVGFGSGSFNEGASAVYGQDAQMIRESGKLPKTNTQRWANIAGIAQSMATSVSEYVTFGKWSDNVGRLLGVNSAVRSGMGEIGTAGAMRIWSGAVKFGKAFARQEFDEVFLDEMKEGILGEGAEQITSRMRALAEENSLSPTTAIAATLESIVSTARKSDDILKSVMDNAGMMALTVAPMALLGAGGDMREAMPRSYRAAKTAARSSKAEDMGRFIDTLITETANATPEQIAAADKAMRDVHVAEEAAVILTSDPELEQTNATAAKAQEQADAHEAEAKASEKRMGAAQAAYYERKGAGDIDGANRALANFAKAKQGFNEHMREAEQKQAEADKAFAQGVQTAVTKAEARVNAQEAAVADPPAPEIDPMDNVRALEAEEFIAQKYPDATEEQRRAVYEEFMQDDAPVESEEPEAKLSRANAEFAAQISRKFGVNIRFGSLGGAEGAYSRKADTIFLDENATQGDVIRSVMVHELTHRTENSTQYDELAEALLSMKYGEDSVQLDADIQSVMSRYASYYAQQGREVAFTQEDARRELVADAAAEIIGGNEEMINRLAAEKPGIGQRILDAIKSVIDRLRGVRDPEMENLRRIEALLEKALESSGEGRGEQYSLRWSKDGKRYVEIEEDILEGVPEDRWVKTVMDTLRDRFKDGIPVGNNIIRVTRKTRKEWSSSGDTKWFRHNDKRAYADKMRASGSADEIVQASGNYVNEKPVHSRTDGTVDFGRGNVLLSIGGNDYEAEVLMGSNPDGSVFLYDMLRMTPTSIQKKTHRPGSRRSVPRSRDASSDYSVHDGTSVVNPQSMQNGEKYSLPSKNLLRQEVSAWRKARRAEAQREEEGRKGERQFVKKTLQNSRAIPSYIRQALFNDPNSRYYEMDSNDEQIIRAYQTIQQEGKEAATERILTSRELPTKDEIAQANVLMAQAAHDGDMSTLLALSRHYAEDTTEIAQALQAMKIFKRMTPAGAMSAAAAQNEALLAGYIQGHEPMRREVEAQARRVESDIEQKKGGDPIALLGSGETVLTKENSKWGVPVNERQEALIKHYKLESETRPGIHYNRATLKQRMLEAILATPDPLEATNEGLTLVTRLEYMKKGAPVVTNADLAYIGHQLAMYTSMDADTQEGREGQLALARAYEANANITQAGAYEKINGARFLNMLLNLTSPTRNVMGNVLQTGVNTASNAVATILDMGVSLGTKERTKALITPKEAVEGWEAFAQETADTFRDYFVDKAIVKQGEGRFDVNRRGRIYQGKAAETARITESFLMSVGDRNFWKMAYTNSMNEQMRVARKNGQELDWDAAKAQAEQDANYATFNEDNAVRDVLARFKRAGVIGKGIDLLMPFTGVPTNIMKRQLEYGPVGLAYTCIKHAGRAAQKQTFDQRAFVEELARGLTGTGLMVLGFGLKQLGMIIGGTSDEEDTEAYYMRTARGEQYTPFIKVGDEYVSLSTFAPAVSPILMGATAYDAWKNDESLLQAFMNATSASLDSIIDASYFSAIQDVLTGDGTFAENLEQTLLTSVATQSTPSLMSQLASSMDPYVRDTKDKDWMKQALNKAIARVPILRETLPVKYDVTGEAVENTKAGWRAFLDPFTTTDAENDAAVNELLALYERTGEKSALSGYLISSNGYTLSVTKTIAKETGSGKEAYKLELTADQKKEVNRMYGDILFNGDGRNIDGLRDLIESGRWSHMDDEERLEEIKDMKSEVKAEVIKWAIKEYGTP